MCHAQPVESAPPAFRDIKSGSALSSPDRQMFQREKKAGFPFYLFGLFDPRGLVPFQGGYGPSGVIARQG
ncbi:hypothetical protein FZC78_14020 [Rossellomorea vietnamensis]|uniref:Uncharacterized protein n=1 Tax=Rossellomorea vietnamensis TaxID=218284 RepID=A0A5D4NPW8_9BACI|nr:hypothetical protein FZC78_14020 [Rossellomorea vietnamensis]